MSFATLVLIDDATAENLVSFVATTIGNEEGKAFAESCNKLIESRKGVELVAAILSKSDVVMALEDDNDVEGYFRATITVLLRFGEENSTASIADVAARLSADTQDTRSRLRLRLLLVLFNLLSIDSTKYATIMTIFQFACDTNQTESVRGFHSAMLEWSTSWSLSSGQKRALYLLVRKSLHNSTKEEEARGFFLHYMRTFPSTVALPQDALALVIEGVVEFLNTPVAAFIERSSMLEILSPAQVAATAQLIHLRDLLSIVCLGNLTEYRSYIAKANNMQVLTSLKVDCTQLETNMRLLNLCTATMSVNKDGMSYDQVAAALDVSIDDVEMWIVTAIASGVLEANLNQSSRMMTITRCSYRAFGMEQWKEIQKKLTILRANVAGVYDEMVRSRRGN